ncbi:hypothetical protein EIP91_003317 [Steccherinum ochraceum]|uniref:Uncharacterized protein n=1 Tax=Steccherinum ochraceum TaxID=92696 RepID=A0A4R0RMH3_9APHY|nr:hypothetical protein EIP91_003317 [Steccherinum ochraceum]
MGDERPLSMRSDEEVPHIHMVSPSLGSSTPRKEMSDYFGGTPRAELPEFLSASVQRAPSPKPTVKSVAEKETAEETTMEEQSDLLLDVAMTTTFASLLDGTPIMDSRSMASFLSLFLLVWWIWASHVAYNARFREYNWPNRVFLFFQLLVFCAFAAFTNNFDIENGIVDNSAQEAQLDALRQAQNWDNSTIQSKAFTEDRGPTLNIRGISMVMAFSRILMLVQYFYALGFTTHRNAKNRHLFYVHLGTLFISVACYVAAFIRIGSEPDRNAQIVKIILWIAPILLEVGSQFLVSLAADSNLAISVKYNAKTFAARSATVFIIILGGGLDNITQGFHFMVGNLSFGPHRVAVIFCASLIFILLFTLHFTTIPDPERADVRDDGVRRRRDLGLFFFGFFYLCAVVITLQGMASMMQVGNVADSMQTAFQFLRTTEEHLATTNYSSTLTSDMYDANTIERLKTNGYDINTILSSLNVPIALHMANTTFPTIIIDQALYVTDMNILGSGLQIINALPQDPQSIITNEILAYVTAGATALPNTITTKDAFVRISEDVINLYATPALWFSASGGAILLILAGMALIDRWGSLHVFSMAQIISRFIMGAALVLLVILDVNASTVKLDADYNYTGAAIWRLATKSWILPAYALILLLEQAWEAVDFGITSSLDIPLAQDAVE